MNVHSSSANSTPGDATRQFQADGDTGTLRVRATQLDIGYNGDPVVSDIQFCVEPGESLAIMGMNGSGKSTLLKTLIGLLPPQRGHIEVLGGRPGASPRRIAYLSQFHTTDFILPLRVLDVVKMGRFPVRGLLGRMTSEDDDYVNAAIEQMGIGHLRHAPLRSLSGGQLQRTFLAQVLAHRADLIVLDEPTAGLDAGGKEVYLQAIRTEQARGTSIISATHDIQEAAACDLVLLLAHRIVGFGKPVDILTPERILETFGVGIMVQRDRLVVTTQQDTHEKPRSRNC